MASRNYMKRSMAADEHQSAICIHNQTSYLQCIHPAPLMVAEKFYPPASVSPPSSSFYPTLLCLLPMPLFCLFHVQHKQPYANVPQCQSHAM